MKKGKLLIATATLALAIGVSVKIGTSYNTYSKDVNPENNIVLNAKSLNASGSEASIFASILKTIASKGGSMVGAKMEKYAIDVLKNYGIDLRSAELKMLDKIDNEIKEVKEKIDSISDKIDKKEAEDSLKDLYSFIDTTQVNLMPLVQGGLVSLAQKEASGEYTDDQLDEARKDFFNISLYHLSIPKATSLVNFVTDFANHILIPNSVDKSQNVFDYYQLSVGRFDKWSSQSYTNRRNYIAYLDTILLSAANLAIFDASHRIENISDDASKKSIETSFNNMIKAVNSVNKMFQNELTRLEEYKKLEENKQIKYLPTNTIYSTRLATMTYDFNSDKQGFVKTLATKDNKKFNGMGLLFQASNIVDKVAKDYSDYMKTWKVKDYSLVKYLKDAGFYANDSKAFETSLGLYKGDMDYEYKGLFDHDTEFRFKYYNNNGELKRDTAFNIGTFHKWLGLVREVKVTTSNKNYFLSFIKGNQTELDGQYKSEYTRTENNDIFYNLKYRQIYDSTNKNQIYSAPVNEKW